MGAFEEVWDQSPPGEIPPASGRALHRGFDLAGVAFLPAMIRWNAAERTIEGLRTAMGRFIDVFTPQGSANDFAAAGYHAD